MSSTSSLDSGRSSQLESTAKMEVKYRRYLKSVFHVSNWSAIVLIFVFSFFTGLSYVHPKIINMKNECDNPKFIQQPRGLSLKVPVMTGICVFILVLLELGGRMIVYKKVIKEDVINIVNFFVGLLLCWEICFILQNMTGYPAPYFFQDEKLRFHYCCAHCPDQQVMTTAMRTLDRTLRRSFPSFVMCALWYLAVYLLVITHYLDTTRSFVIKVVLFLAPSFVSCFYGIMLWEHKLNHLEDIVGGTLIGAGLALVALADFLVRDNKKMTRFMSDFLNLMELREERTTGSSCRNLEEVERDDPGVVETCLSTATTLRVAPVPSSPPMEPDEEKRQLNQTGSEDCPPPPYSVFHRN